VQVFDNGSNPKDDDDRRSGSSKTREELGASFFSSFVFYQQSAHSRILSAA
jgi:hypothetical protein